MIPFSERRAARPLRPLFVTWVALLALVAATLGSAYLPLGAFNGVVNLAIAAVKALLVALVFMRLGRASPITRLVAFGVVGWLLVLLGIAGFDTVMRSVG